MDSQHRASFLSSLKQHWSMMRGGETAFIEEVPLKEQVCVAAPPDRPEAATAAARR